MFLSRCGIPGLIFSLICQLLQYELCKVYLLHQFTLHTSGIQCQFGFPMGLSLAAKAESEKKGFGKY